MANIQQTCNRCNKQFLIIDQEQVFLQNKELPLPLQCPSCRQQRRLMLRGGRQLFRTKCQQCGKDIVTVYDPQKVKNRILCKADYDQFFMQNDPILKDPIP